MTGILSMTQDIPEQWRLVHMMSALHRARIMNARWCGCFHCCAVYSAAAIEDWTDERQTALCPRCNVDSVLPTNDKDVLEQMRYFYFSLPRGM